jgi:predicted nuclease with TOPRIM domain
MVRSCPLKGGSVIMYESDELDTTLGVIRGVQLEHDLLIRETQRTVARIEKVQQTHGRRLERLEDKVDRLEGRFDGLETRFDGLEARFDGLEAKFDTKFRDLDTKFRDLDTKVDGIGETLQEVLRRLPAKN